MIRDIITEDIAGILDQDIPWPALTGRRVLVTGATGMIGQYLVRVLLALARHGADAGRKGARVIAMTRRGDEAARLFASELGDGRLEIMVHDPARSPPPLPWLDYIVHAGSPADPVAFREDPVGVIAANAQGAANLLAAARERDAVFCLLSSAEIYGQGRDACAQRVSETTAGVLDSLDPRSPYPESKRLAEALCVAYERQHGVGYRIARLAHTYGPGMRLDDPRVQAYFMRQALNGQDITLQSSGQAKRSYTYVSDAISGLLHLMAAPESLACNIANDRAVVSIADLARVVLRCCPDSHAQLKFADAAQREGAPTMAPPILDCSRLRALGWTPRVELEAGIGRTLQHHRSLASWGAVNRAAVR